MNISTYLIKNKNIPEVNFLSYLTSVSTLLNYSKENLNKHKTKLIKDSNYLYDCLLMSQLYQLENSHSPNDFRSINSSQIFFYTKPYDIYILSEFKDWLSLNKPHYPNLPALFSIYTPKELHMAFLYLKSANLFIGNNYSNTISLSYPITGILYSLTDAYKELQTLLKKHRQLTKDIISTVKSLPALRKKELLSLYSKLSQQELLDALIPIIVNLETKPIDNITKESPLFKLILSELTNYTLPKALNTYLKPDKIKEKPLDLYAEIQRILEKKEATRTQLNVNIEDDINSLLEDKPLSIKPKEQNIKKKNAPKENTKQNQKKSQKENSNIFPNNFSNFFSENFSIDDSENIFPSDIDNLSNFFSNVFDNPLDNPEEISDIPELPPIIKKP